MSEYKGRKEYTELDFVFDIVNYLEQRLDKYDKYIKYIWEEVAVPFINSHECQINIDTASYKSEKEFENMMKNVLYYRNLESSHKKYTKRCAQLQNELDKESFKHAV
jgi:hypothetical protein